jgi:hypothetical protein
MTIVFCDDKSDWYYGAAVIPLNKLNECGEFTSNFIVQDKQGIECGSANIKLSFETPYNYSFPTKTNQKEEIPIVTVQEPIPTTLQFTLESVKINMQDIQVQELLEEIKAVKFQYDFLCFPTQTSNMYEIPNDGLLSLEYMTGFL